MNPTHINTHVGDKTLDKKKNTIESSLLDIFTKSVSTIHDGHNTSLSLENSYTKSLDKIISYGEGDIVSALKKSLGKNKAMPLSLQEVGNISISLKDIVIAFKNIGVKNKLPTEHSKAIAKTFLYNIESAIYQLNPAAQEVYKKEVVANKEYIYSLEYLGIGLQKFFDECKKGKLDLSEKDIDAIYETSISFTDITHQANKLGIISGDEIKASGSTGSISIGSEQEKLLNTHMTLYGVSKIQTIFNKYKAVEQKLEGVYNFSGIEQLWSGPEYTDEVLASFDPAFKMALESIHLSDTDKATARVSVVGHYMISKNNSFGKVLLSLVDNNFDFSLLSQKDQDTYLEAYKNIYLSSQSGKDLIDYFTSFGVSKQESQKIITAFFSSKNEDITLKSKQGDIIEATINKRMLSGKSKIEMAYIMTTQGLPFVFELKSESLGEKDKAALHTRSGGFYAGKIPHALTLLAGTKAIASVTNEEFKNLDNVYQEEKCKDTFTPEYPLLNTTSFSGIDDVYDIDWEDEESIQKLTVDELQHTKTLYSKQIAGLNRDIQNIQSKEKSLSEELKVLHDAMYKTKNASQEQKDSWEESKKKLEQQRGDIHTDKAVLEEELQEAIEKRKHIESLITTKKQTTSIPKENDSIDEIPPKKDAPEEINYYKETELKWNGLQGDKSAPFAVGSSICVDLPDRKGPLLGWKHPWARGEITHIDSEGNFDVKFHGIDAPIPGVNEKNEAIEGSTIKFYGASGIDAFLGKVGKMWKFGKETSWKEFGLQLKEKGLDVDKEQKDYLDHFLKNVDFGSMYRKDAEGKIIENDKNKIKYLGGNVDDLIAGEKENEKKVGTQKVWYEIQQHKDGVTVSGKDRDGHSYSKKMSPQEFIVFVTDKGLSTYTQTEVDKINTDRAGEGLQTLQSEIDRSHDITPKKKRLWTNLKSIGHAAKFGLDGVKKRLKDKQGKDDKALERAMLGSKWFQKLSKLPIIGDAFEDMYIGLDKELDSEKTKEIKEAMEEPEKNGEDNKDGPYNYILNAGKFKEVAEGGTLTDEKKARKFAGYYCYVLSKKTTYPSTLAKYAGQGIWVRGLLGPKYQDQYFQHINQMKDNIAKNPNDGESKKLLGQGELGFMKKVYGDGDDNVKARFNAIYGKSFFDKTLGDLDGAMFDLGEVETVSKKAKTKLFNNAKGDFDKAFLQRRPIDMYGTLKGMGENIKSDPSNYREWMLRLALPILSGMTVANMDEDMRKDYALLSRQYATPFGLYGKDADGPKQLWELFGIVSTHPSVGADFLKEFVDFMPTATENRPRESQFEEFHQKMTNRWFNHGHSMLELLSQPGKLIQMKSDLEKEYQRTSDSSPRKQELLNKIMSIKHYIDKKVNDDEQGEVEVKLGGIVAEKNIINLSPGAIRRLLNYRNGGFQKELVEDGPKAWKALSKQVKSYNPSNGEKASKDVYQFVLKKFLVFFEDKAHFTTSNINQLLVGLKYSNTPDAMKVFLSDVIDPNGQAPKDVKDAIDAFLSFLKNNKPSEEDMKLILDAIIDNTVGDKYLIADPSGIKDNTKKENTKLKTKVSSEIMKEKGINTYMDSGDGVVIYKDRSGNLRNKNGYYLEKEGGGKGGSQKNKEIELNLLDQNKRYIKLVKCYHYDENQLPSYEDLTEGGTGYYDPYDGYSGGFD